MVLAEVLTVSEAGAGGREVLTTLDYRPQYPVHHGPAIEVCNFK